MKSALWLLLTIPVLVLNSPAIGSGGELASKIEAVTNAADHRGAHWGILIVDAQNGEILYALNPDHLFFPASTTKLYSCATALAELGADHRFETPVYALGPIVNGRLHGDLILVASGDLTLGGRTDASGHIQFKNNDHIYANGSSNCEWTDTNPLAGLEALARQVAAAGVRRVDGDVRIDDRLFEHSRSSGSGPEVVSPIVINDNVVDVRIRPGAAVGLPAVVETKPVSAAIQLDVQVDTVAVGQPLVSLLRWVDAQRLIIRGQIPVNAKPVLRIAPVADPAAFARVLFMEALRGAGVAVAASPWQPPARPLPDREAMAKLTKVAAFTSPPLAEVLKVTLKVSHNLYASTLPLLVAAKHGRRTLADGMRVQRQFLAQLGVDVESISFGGGAGGSNADMVTPRTSVQLLAGLAKRKDYAAFEEALPILGVDGTLADAVPPDSPAKGKVRAKTGTLVWHDAMNDRSLVTSKALAGTLTTASGRKLILALYLNGVPLPKGQTPAREGKLLGRLCEVIYQAVP